MTAQTLPKLMTNAWFAVSAAAAIVFLSFLSFVVAEPQISHSQFATSTAFTVSQTITGEATFLVNPANVTMDGDINGLTGGNSTGTAGFVVQSNSGYYVTIDFFDNAGTYTMYGDSTGSEDIFDYRYGDAGSAEPDFGFTPEANASFAYTVAASSTITLDPSFQHNNTDTCNTGSNTTADLCWATPSTTEFTIIDSGSTPTAQTGASTTVKFRVNVPSGATPQPYADTYTATVTLSLYTQ